MGKEGAQGGKGEGMRGEEGTGERKEEGGRSSHGVQATGVGFRPHSHTHGHTHGDKDGSVSLHRGKPSCPTTFTHQLH